MSTKAKLFLVDDEGKPAGRTTLFITARPALLRWVLKPKGSKEGHSSYFKRTGVDEYKELTPKQVVHVLDYLKQKEVDPEQLTIDMVDEILAKPHIEAPRMVVTPQEAMDEQRAKEAANQSK